jgi:hypothetical protein
MKQELETTIQKAAQPKLGDILLFKAPTAQDIISKNASLTLIMSGQILSSMFGKSRGGHFDTTHAAICTGYDDSGNLLITHFTGEAGTQETVTLNRFLDGEDRSFLIFSPNDSTAIFDIVHEARKPEYSSQKYSYMGTFLSLFRKWKLRSKNKVEREESTFCSAFVAKVLKLVGIDLGVGTECTPKSLEAGLRSSPKFILDYHLGPNGTKDIINEIEKEIKRLEKGTDKSKNKAITLRNALESVTLSSDFNLLSESGKAVLLLKNTLPTLATHTKAGPHVMRPASYRKIMKLAIRKGFSKTELDSKTTPPLHRRSKTSIEYQANQLKKAHQKSSSI